MEGEVYIYPDGPINEQTIFNDYTEKKEDETIAPEIPTEPPAMPEREPTEEEIEARKTAFMNFWHQIEHLKDDPNFDRLPIPMNWTAILNGLYKYEPAEKVEKRLTEIEHSKMIELKEEVEEKLREYEENKVLLSSGEKKRRRKKRNKELKNE